MGKNDLIVALCHSAESLSEHLPTAGVRVLNPLQAQSADLSVDIILHDARTASPADDSTGVDSLLKSHPSASLIALVDDGQSVNFTSLQGGLSFRTLNVAQLKAGELPKLITSLSSVHASAGNLAHRSVLASLKSVSNPKMDRKLQVDIIEQALAEVIHLTAADFAAFYMKENSDGSAFRVMTAGNALAWPMNRTFNTSELVELAFKSEEIQQAEYVQDVDSAVGNAGAVAMECIVPMLVDQQAVGVVQIAFSQYQPNFAHLCENLQNFIAVAGVVIENDTLLLKAKRELKRTKALSELSMSLHAGGSIQSIRNSVCEWIVDNMGAASAGFIVCSEDQIVSSQMRCIAGENNPQQGEFAELGSIDQTVYQWAHDKKERVIIARGEKDPRESPLIHQMRERENLGALVCIPLLSSTSVSAMLVVQKKRTSKNFSESELSILDNICSQMCIAVHREELLGEIAHKAYHDPLTLIPNRYQFERNLSEAIQQYGSHGKKLGLILFDIDQFKSINETAGHDVGDMLLVLLAERFVQHMRPMDVVARIGGDEFVVLLPDVEGEHSAVVIAQRLLEQVVREPFEIDNVMHRLGAQVGVSLFPDHGQCCENLLKHAGIAKHSGKTSRLNEVTVFDQDMAAAYRRKLEISAQMQDALVWNQFELYYQPQVCMQTKAVVGVEALIRWNHPDKGLVSPAEFIPIAENSGFISSIGSWVIDEACRQMAVWNEQGISGITVAVNIAAQQFEADDFVQQTLGCISRHGIEASSLELEVTESVVMREIEVVAEKLLSFREANIKLAIDDFGTGYSSLRYLQDLPLDILKIDRSFVMRLEENDNSTVAHSIAALAQSLGLLTVAEGVETADQLARICDLNVDFVQGYYYSKPVPAEDLPRVMASIHALSEPIQLSHS